MVTSQSQENLELRIKRLRYRSWHRGIKEMDIILGQFADAHLRDLTAVELDEYESILSHNDHQLYGWITGRIETPEEVDSILFQRIASTKHVQL